MLKSLHATVGRPWQVAVDQTHPFCAWQADEEVKAPQGEATPTQELVEAFQVHPL
jgi:hypothetical protein